MTREIPAEARDLLESQAGVLSRAQALRAGLTDKQIKAACRGGRWQRLHTGVYAAFTGEPGRPALLWAAVLRGGPAAVLSHHSAAELYGLITTPVPAIHVMVPAGRPIAPVSGVIVHYSSLLARTRHPILRPPRTRVEETVLDLASSADSLDTALSWVLRGCASRRTTPERIAAAMALRTRMRWRTELGAALGLGAQGVHSLLEFRYVNRVERPHGLPAGTRQYRVTRAGQRQYQDVTYQAYGVVVELDGRAAHPEELRWRDVRRDNATHAAGQVTLRYGWPDVTQRPCLAAAEVAAVLSGHGWDGRLRRCGPACQLPP